MPELGGTLRDVHARGFQSFRAVLKNVSETLVLGKLPDAQQKASATRPSRLLAADPPRIVTLTYQALVADVV